MFEEIAGQAELRENQQLESRGCGLSHPLPLPLEIASTTAEGRVHLNQPDREPAVPAHAGRCGRPADLPAAADTRASRPRTSHWSIAGAISAQCPRWTAARGRASRKAVP